MSDRKYVLISLMMRVVLSFSVLWFNPSQQLSTTQLPSHSPAVGWGSESEEKK